MTELASCFPAQIVLGSQAIPERTGIESSIDPALPGDDGTYSEVSLALLYKKPIVIYCSDPSDVANLPSATRMTSIQEVENFLHLYV